MKYKDRDDLVAGLREFADFIEEKGLELPIREARMHLSPWLFDDYVWKNRKRSRTAKEKLRRAVLAIGKAEKNFEGGSFKLIRSFGPITLQFQLSRQEVCEKRVIARKQIPEQVIEAYEEEVVEWICTDPILAGV